MRHTRSGVVYDFHSKKDEKNFGLKLKALINFDVGENNCHFFYFLNIGKEECVFCAFGHHFLQDGKRLIQTINFMTYDNETIKLNKVFIIFLLKENL